MIAGMPPINRKKRIFLIAALGIVVVWVWLALAPSHFFKSVDFGTVNVDGRVVPAEIYFGRPTYNEAEIFALVRVKRGHDFLFDFDSEGVREVKRSEYMLVPHGVWFIRSMQRGAFVQPLPFQKENEFRLWTSDGHYVSVQF